MVLDPKSREQGQLTLAHLQKKHPKRAETMRGPPGYELAAVGRSRMTCGMHTEIIVARVGCEGRSWRSKAEQKTVGRR
ncbi:hypothetical protein JTB14_006624 [Gonioctena quinquepunctata]|nr:hypothetical protein JTB14_006624 [Gonioctena quinquepunctata]